MPTSQGQLMQSINNEHYQYPLTDEGTLDLSKSNTLRPHKESIKEPEFELGYNFFIPLTYATDQAVQLS